MRFGSKLLTLAAAASLSAMASATPLNDYNLILFGDLNPSGSVHVHGTSFIGGDLNGSSPEFVNQLNKSLTIDTDQSQRRSTGLWRHQQPERCQLQRQSLRWQCRLCTSGERTRDQSGRALQPVAGRIGFLQQPWFNRQCRSGRGFVRVHRPRH